MFLICFADLLNSVREGSLTGHDKITISSISQALKFHLVIQSQSNCEFIACILCMMLLVYSPNSVYVKHTNGWTVSVKS